MTSKSQNLVELISRSTLPAKDYSSILRAIGSAKVVMIGKLFMKRFVLLIRCIVRRGLTWNDRVLQRKMRDHQKINHRKRSDIHCSRSRLAGCIRNQ